MLDQMKKPETVDIERFARFLRVQTPSVTISKFYNGEDAASGKRCSFHTIRQQAEKDTEETVHGFV